MFSCNFKFKSHIHKMVQKANKVLGVINQTFKYLDLNIMRLLYTSLVRPHLDYASNIWNPYLLEDMRTIEKLQRRATKLTQQEKHTNALPYSTVLLPVSHGYTTETAIVLILTFSPVFSVSVPLLLDVSSCSVPSSSWFAGAWRWFCLSIYN